MDIWTVLSLLLHQVFLLVLWVACSSSSHTQTTASTVSRFFFLFHKAQDKVRLCSTHYSSTGTWHSTRTHTHTQVHTHSSFYLSFHKASWEEWHHPFLSSQLSIKVDNEVTGLNPSHLREPLQVCWNECLKWVQYQVTHSSDSSYLNLLGWLGTDATVERSSSRLCSCEPRTRLSNSSCCIWTNIWKKVIFFQGTTFYNLIKGCPQSELPVRRLCWHESEWK